MAPRVTAGRPAGRIRPEQGLVSCSPAHLGLALHTPELPVQRQPPVSGAPSSGLVSAGTRPGPGFLLTSCMLPFGGIPTGWAAGPEGQWGAGRAILHPEWSPPSVCVAWGKRPTSVGLPHP